LFSDGRCVSLGPKNEIPVGRGDRIRIETPGGGGFGKKLKKKKLKKKKKKKKNICIIM
jgi:N-methylhydantoinase B/oxoprolinase/acetone carboxylase alpha subunit